MSESLAGWLALREPADVVARSVALTTALVRALGPRDRLAIIDLGSGTGSNVRYLADRLPASQRWLLVDRNPTVLAELSARMSPWAAARAFTVTTEHNAIAIRGPRLDCHVETLEANLGLKAAPRIFAGRHLVTASALLDLVSESWLQWLARQCRLHGAAALFALTYNGRSRCVPEEPEDDAIRELMNQHQRSRDHGFGPAGPDAAGCAARCFAAEGFQVRLAESNWVLTPADGDLQRPLIEGWAEAAVEIAPDQEARISNWLARRIAHVEADRSHVTVGHDDLAAWLAP